MSLQPLYMVGERIQTNEKPKKAFLIDPVKTGIKELIQLKSEVKIVKKIVLSSGKIVTEGRRGTRLQEKARKL
ncbi:hypothetical protein JTB14_010284 [Gonioctena quinquepunctata]|nr:hypothetical protein JTB14_010284 [Gonioctena quinquepunctata]